MAHAPEAWRAEKGQTEGGREGREGGDGGRSATSDRRASAVRASVCEMWSMIRAAWLQRVRARAFVRRVRARARAFACLRVCVRMPASACVGVCA